MLQGPTRFGWLLPGALAGSGRPGRHASLEEDLVFLRNHGIDVIVSLLETTLNLTEYRAGRFEVHHFPVEDFTAPELEQIVESCAIIERSLSSGRKVLVHCNAGIGRTGAILACSLVRQGEIPEEAVRRVRHLRPYSLETSSQVEIVCEYHRSLLQSEPKLEPENR
ncbi:MAG TPA: dual specificity protein phosphatase family protein [Vicinamibacteria bacterium]|jgi:atypical dual specificity phosphatase